MPKPCFVIAIADLERGPRDLSWELSRSWLAHALEGSEAEPVADGRLEVSVAKNGKEVLVRGRAVARVTMPDSHTLEPVELELSPEVFLMLFPASTPEPHQRRPRAGRAKKAPEGPRTPEKAGPARGWSSDPELRDADSARDTYAGDQVVLDVFVREFLLLEIPMVVHKDLPSEPAAGIAPPPAARSPETVERVDPRLAPLAAIAERMRGRKS